MRRFLAPLVAGLALTASLGATPASAAPSTCTAVDPGPKASCTYQSSGGTSELTCAAWRCTVSFGTSWVAAELGERRIFWTSYGDVVRLRAYDGAANAGDARFDLR